MKYTDLCVKGDFIPYENWSIGQKVDFWLFAHLPVRVYFGFKNLFRGL